MPPNTSWDMCFKNVKGKLFQALNVYEVNNLPLPISLFSFYCWPDFPERDIWWVSGKEGCKGFPVRFRYHFLPPEPGLLPKSSEGFWAERNPPECDFFISYPAFHIYLMHIFNLKSSSILSLFWKQHLQMF